MENLKNALIQLSYESTSIFKLLFKFLNALIILGYLFLIASRSVVFGNNRNILVSLIDVYLLISFHSK